MGFFKAFPKTTYQFPDGSISDAITDIFRYVKVTDAFLDNISAYTYYLIENGDRPDVVSNILYDTPDHYWTFFLINDQLKSGLSGWPMSSLQLDTFLDTEYDGTVLVSNPTIVYNSFGLVTEFRDSVAGKFVIGETITGGTSGATGTLLSKDAQLSQLVLTDTVGTFIANESVAGFESGNIITTVTAVYPWRYAPHHYVDPTGLVSYNSLYIFEGNDLATGDFAAGIQPLTPNTTNYPVDTDLTMVTNNDYETALNDQRAQIKVIQPSEIYNFSKTYRDLINA